MGSRHLILGVAFTACLAVAACGGAQPADDTKSPSATPSASASASGATPAPVKADYPEPRYPSYLKPPASIDEIMPYMRTVIRNKTGLQGAGFGILEKGESVLIVAGASAEEIILEALKRGLEERGVKPIIIRDYDLTGTPKAEAERRAQARRKYTSEFGYLEAANWVNAQFPDSTKAREWFKGRRPDLYDKMFPPDRDNATPPPAPDQAEEVARDAAKNAVARDAAKNAAAAASAKRKGGAPKKAEPAPQVAAGGRGGTGEAIKAYLQKNPHVRGVYWGKGGSTTLRRQLRPLESKFLGLFVVDNRWDVMSQLGTYPGDVWQLAEDQVMEPIVHVDKLHIADPEGTNIGADLTETMAQNWSRGVYQRGHLYMFPNQATGRFGYSVVDYPAFQGDWLPREPMALANGIIAGTVNHTGFYPRWEVTVKDGYIRDVKGGGMFGEALKEFLQYPNINDQVFPFHEKNHPGYWWLYEIAMGTHPKGYRHPGGLETGQATPERNRAGVLHWGLGVTLHHDPGSPEKSQQLVDFTEKWNLPKDHGWHTHTYFSTYKVHLRNANQWVTLIDRGRMTTLDNPEVRALASRYGNPDQILTEDWRPNVPGVNMPGDYQQYAANPWTFVKGAIDQVKAGTYDRFFPKPAAVAGTK